ncbi:hypothetical protein L484_007004 [Morus notabilis]|uniref:Ninja-family protein n=1 Tax=Morus notabilis TaxID=981085 RepID=W9RW04_9ROSA|nr:hypothetical protein L484_007004 [Morus notabilis]
MAMVEVSEIGLKEDELELELGLGLSIGGSFRKLSETPKPAKRESGLFPFDSNKSNGFPLDPKEIQTTTSRSSTGSPTVFEIESGILDPKTKREIHALRRQEAKKKQKEKRCRGRNNSLANSIDSQSVQEYQQRASKREKTESNSTIGPETGFNGVDGVRNGNDQNPSNGGQTVHYPVGAVQYPYAPVQFVPYASGFAYPCVVPCWAPPGGSEKSVFQPVARRGFRPFVAHPSFGLSLPNGCDSEKSGDGSSETRTPSSYSSPEQNRKEGSKPNDNKCNSSEVQSCCSHQTNNIDHHEDREEAKPGFESLRLEESISTTENPSPNSLMETKMDITGKPPRPQSLSRNITPPPTALPQMPCVSTRGNGPNGKTVRGFLYKYTNSEVSIVCVCHGSTFSPAEFVQHAGGTDVSHPLKHITVIPFSLN